MQCQAPYATTLCEFINLHLQLISVSSTTIKTWPLPRACPRRTQSWLSQSLPLPKTHHARPSPPGILSPPGTWPALREWRVRSAGPNRRSDCIPPPSKYFSFPQISCSVFSCQPQTQLPDIRIPIPEQDLTGARFKAVRFEICGDQARCPLGHQAS